MEMEKLAEDGGRQLAYPYHLCSLCQLHRSALASKAFGNVFPLAEDEGKQKVADSRNLDSGQFPFKGDNSPCN
jgi:hypothetical protein